MIRKSLAILAGLLLVPGFLLAYTSPGKPAGFVNDFASLLKPETVSSLENTLQSFSDTTGNQIVVVTVATLGDESVETSSEKLFSEWGIGQEKEDNGLLLLVARDEREVRIEVGYGLEPVITDLESSRIIREIIVPAFQKGDYDTGITEAVSRIVSDINNGYPENTEEPGRHVYTPSNYIIQLFFFLIVVIGSILGRSKSWWMGGIIGAVVALILGLIKTSLSIGIFSAVIFIPIGLLVDYLASKAHQKHRDGGGSGPWFWGGGFGGRGGGFGGFGGGMSGGGGASGRW